MDPEQAFIRVQERFSQALNPRVRTALDYIYLFAAITLFCILVVMHSHFVQQNVGIELVGIAGLRKGKAVTSGLRCILCEGDTLLELLLELSTETLVAVYRK